jgi:NAD(P)-dependent dehydrogenase (short-subunit alcohol dehydrogenase family)
MPQLALVTGTSSGIGRACAELLRDRGWEVLAGVRSAGDAPEGCEELLLDVTDPAQVAAAAERVGGRLDALVANAGVALSGPLEFVPLDELRAQLEVNVVGQVALLQALLPALREARGRVVLMGSVSGRLALPFLGPYAASKFALEAVADALRGEVAPFGIAVSLVQPGSIATPMWRKGGERAARLEPAAVELYGGAIAALREWAAKRGAVTPPAEVARTVEHALTAERPRTRYVVGAGARTRTLIGRAPDRLRDRLIGRLIARGATR